MTLSICSFVTCSEIRYVAAPGGERGLIVSTQIYLLQYCMLYYLQADQ